MSNELDTAAADVDDSTDFQPITSQDALDKIIGQRIDRVKKQYTGFGELKAKAAQFDEYQEATKTESQRDRERIAALETELASERDSRMRATVAASKGVPSSAISGSTQEELEASADELIEWRGKQENKTAKPVRGLKSGSTGNAELLDPKEAAAAAIRALRSQ